MDSTWRRDRKMDGMRYRYRHCMRKLLIILLLHPANSFLDSSIGKPYGRLSTTAATNPRCEMMGSTSSDECSAPPPRVGGENDSDNRLPKGKSLRRKIPYVESFGEQLSRELWERDPFRGAEHVVDSIIGSGDENFGKSTCHTQFSPILNPVDQESENYQRNATHPIVSPFLSGYEDSFDLLYKCKGGDNSCSNGEHGGTDPRNNTTSDVLGTASITASHFAKIPDDHETRKEKTRNFCLRVAYRGDDFCGWQTQLSNTEQPSVQRTLEEWLTELQNDQRPLDAECVAERKNERQNQKQECEADNGTMFDIAAVTTSASNQNSTRIETRGKQTIRSKKQSQKPKWADLPVAGRTDSGVSAIGQLCRFRTYRKDLTVRQILDFLETKIQTTTTPPVSRSLRVTEITPVTKAFHPTFTTSCRAYAYLIDIESFTNDNAQNPYVLLEGDRAEEQVALLDAMLRTIEGKTLDYIDLSYGRVKTTNTLCTLHHARARWVEYQSPPSSTTTCTTVVSAPDHHHSKAVRRAVCIELVGDRFLRRMVRLLVEASVRLVAEATANPESQTNNRRMYDDEKPKDVSTNDDKDNAKDALLRLIEKQDRRLVGRPAPPNGLLFVNARVQSNE